MDKLTVSYSQLDCFMNCPRRYFIEYGCKIPCDKSEALEQGNYLHQGLANVHKELMGISIDKQEIFDISAVKAKYLNELVKLWFAKGLITVAKDCSFIPENKFELEQETFILTSKVDLAIILSNNRYKIVEFKLTSDMSRYNLFLNNMQLGLYSLILPCDEVCLVTFKRPSFPKEYSDEKFEYFCQDVKHNLTDYMTIQTFLVSELGGKELWAKQLNKITSMILSCIADRVWPMNKKACMAYGYPCPCISICMMPDEFLLNNCNSLKGSQDILGS